VAVETGGPAPRISADQLCGLKIVVDYKTVKNGKN
jgi:hypothetical protein